MCQRTMLDVSPSCQFCHCIIYVILYTLPSHLFAPRSSIIHNSSPFCIFCVICHHVALPFCIICYARRLVTAMYLLLCTICHFLNTYFFHMLKVSTFIIILLFRIIRHLIYPIVFAIVLYMPVCTTCGYVYFVYLYISPSSVTMAK